MVWQGASTSRPFAMARPKRSIEERRLVAIAAAENGATGSARSRAKLVANRVAELALANLRGTGDDVAIALQLAEAEVRYPASSALAEDPELDAAGMVRSELIIQFEAAGCRWSKPERLDHRDREAVAAVSDRLAERFRRRLK